MPRIPPAAEVERDGLSPREWVDRYLTDPAHQRDWIFGLAFPCPSPGDRRDRIIAELLSRDLSGLEEVLAGALAHLVKTCGDRRALAWLHSRIEERIQKRIGRELGEATLLRRLHQCTAPEHMQFLLGLIRSGTFRRAAAWATCVRGFSLQDVAVQQLSGGLGAAGLRNLYFEIVGTGLLDWHGEWWILSQALRLGGETFLDELGAEINRRPELVLSPQWAEPLHSLTGWIKGGSFSLSAERPAVQRLIGRLLTLYESRGDPSNLPVAERFAKLRPLLLLP
jgi:hypothetical protein